jgi:endoglucanase
MEFLMGESLGTLLVRERRLPFERAVDLCLQACRGMEAAHGSGIVHRDLKPENLFVCRREDGTDIVKVLDFGIAKLEQIESNIAATRTGAILGTPEYMSPEQARGDKTIDHRTDIYGLAAILFEMLSGEKPHPGDSHNAILHHISTQPAVSLRSVQPDLPAPLIDAVESALASDAGRRHASVETFARALAPFATRRPWPAPAPALAPVPVGDAVAPPADDGGLTLITPDGARAGAPASTSIATFPGQPAPIRARARARMAVAGGAGLIGAGAIALVVAVAAGRFARSPVPAPRPASNQALARDTRFFAPAPIPGAVQQIAALNRQKAFLDAAPLTDMEATPQAVWFTGGTPDDVGAAVQRIMARAAAEHRVPVLMAYNIPFRDCAQYSAGRATDAAAYGAWIDGLAKGIGNGRAVVILEPDSLGIIPNSTTLEGTPDWCKPTVADAQGGTVPAPGATPADRFAALNHAVDSLATRAPSALVYLDGTHAGWLGVGEIASRLVSAGVRRARGFFVNVGNFQPTPQSITYATWISKCIHYAGNRADGGRRLGHYRDCASQYGPDGPKPSSAWAETERWYADNVDHAPNPPAGPQALTHFVIDTSRNGRGPLDAARYAAAPFNQPADVIKGLTAGSWCNPPGAGLGLRPTADTGVPLADAYLWVKIPGASDGSCDIAGGSRAWDYARYNPWGIGGEAQNHFDPLWGAVDPAAGEWFAESALQLAQNAFPPLPTPGAVAGAPAATGRGGEPAPEPRATAGARATGKGARLALAAKRLVSAPPEASGPAVGAAPLTATGSLPVPPTRVTGPPSLRVSFDPRNPYGN